MEHSAAGGFFTSDETAEIYKAIYKLQGKVWNLPRPKINKHTHSTYCPLEAMNEWLRPFLQDAGLIVLQPPHSPSQIDMLTMEQRYREEGKLEKSTKQTATAPMSITTRIIHATSGQFIQTTSTFIPEPVAGNPIRHSEGGGITYYRRYQLMGLLGLVGDEDMDASDLTPVDLPGQQPSPPPPAPEQPNDSQKQTTTDASPEQQLKDAAKRVKAAIKKYKTMGLTPDGLAAIGSKLYESNITTTDNSDDYTVADWNALLDALNEEMK